MSFHSIPVTLRPTSLRWLTRIVLPFVIGAIVLTSTGCSMVMGIFGPTEADVTGVQEQPARLLLPTPIGEGAETTTVAAVRNAPTPTPFVMRPVTTAAVASTNRATNSAPASSTTTSGTMRVIIAGDAVNVRNAPGLDTQVLVTMPRGTELDYVDKSEAGDWIQVCCINGQPAWVYADLVKVEQGTATAASRLPTNPVSQTTNTAVQANPATGTGTQLVAQITTQLDTSRIGINRSGDATRYTSKDDGFSITLPPSWLPIAETHGIVKASIKAIEQDNPEMAALLDDQLSAMAGVPVSLIAFDLAPDTLSTGFATNLNVIKQPIPAGFTLEYVVQFSADQLEQVLGLSDAAESTKVTLPAGEAILLDYELSGQAIARQYYLMHEQALYIVTFTSAASLANSSTILFNEMMQSFTFTN